MTVYLEVQLEPAQEPDDGGKPFRSASSVRHAFTPALSFSGSQFRLGDRASRTHRNSCAVCVNRPTSSSRNRRPTTEIAAPSFSTRPCTSTKGDRFTTSSLGATSGCGTTTFTYPCSSSNNKKIVP